jgi:hypothetical protein
LAFVTFPEPEEAEEVLADSIYLLLQGLSTQLKTSLHSRRIGDVFDTNL